MDSAVTPAANGLAMPATNGLTANKGPCNDQHHSASGEGLGGSERVPPLRTYVVEAAGVCILMLLVWMLLLLPIIFYHLPVATESADLDVSYLFSNLRSYKICSL